MPGLRRKRSFPRALIMLFPTRAVPLKDDSGDTLVAGRQGRVVEVRQLHEAALLALDGVIGVDESYKSKRASQPKNGRSLCSWKRSVGSPMLARAIWCRRNLMAFQPTWWRWAKSRRWCSTRKRALPCRFQHRPSSHYRRDLRVRRARHSSPRFTAGCDGDYLILSNNYVLVDVNAGKPGDLIPQPGPFDGGLFPS